MREDIVISGISGRFPESDNVEEFMENLYSNKDMVVEDDRRWPIGFLDLPRASGKLRDISKFDAQFFGFTDEQADNMDAQIRIMVELAYEAIWDAGIDPKDLSGTRTGTFVSSFYDEVTTAQAVDVSKIRGSHQNFGGILAKIFNFTGPSLVLDTACSSSFYDLHEAFESMRNNLCDQAIVVGVNISLRPTAHLEFARMNMLSPDGKCKCLDSEANGYAKGEACAVVLLQKKDHAKRIYASIVNSRTNSDGYKELGLTFPSAKAQSKLMSETYSQVNVNPHDINYLEAHCTGTPAGDPVEMSAIVEAMCTDRTQPLLIGAVKSSIGHSEVTSGLCSLTKVIFSLENQCIPANLHYNSPNPSIPGLKSGILKPIAVNTPFKDKLVGLNSFGFGGSNIHVIVRGHDKEPTQQSDMIYDGIPRLVVMCGRTKQALEYALNKIGERHPNWTQDYLSLINDISKTSPFKTNNTGYKGMSFRGFLIKDKNLHDDIPNGITITEVPEEKRQTWFIISGVGAQWPGMAKSLMKLSVFARSIEKSAKILQEYKGIDLMAILMSERPDILDCVLNSTVALISLQIALIDVIKGLGISADGIIGYSIGEGVSGYADGCVTHEELLKLSYLLGNHTKERVKRGKMAAIGLKLEEIQRRIPENVYIACHNAEDSFTISGNENALDQFTNQLIGEDVFVRPVNSSNCAFHSPLMNAERNTILNELRTVLPDKRKRSSKWLSTVYSKGDEHGQFVSAEYYVDNIVLPVLFSQALKHVPKNAVIIEVGPHNILQSLVRRCLGSDITYIPLMKRNQDNLQLFLEGIGKIYCSGVNPKIENFYPKVEYPVVRGTPALSPLVKWDHSKSHTVYQYPDYFNPDGFTDNSVKIDLKEPENSYLTGHCIDGRILFPATGYLLMVWKQLAKKHQVSHLVLPVEFENVRFHRATLMQRDGLISFTVKIDDSNGQFVITESGSVTTTGKVYASKRAETRFVSLLNEKVEEARFNHMSEIVLKNQDIYKEFRIRGYDYGKSFQCLSQAIIRQTNVLAKINWTNWVSFADSMLQMAIMGKKYRGLYLPTGIDSLRCDPRQLIRISENDQLSFPVLFDNYTDICVSPFLELRGIRTSLAPRKAGRTPLIEKYIFVPYDETISTMGSNEYLEQYRQKCYKMASNLIEKYSIPAQKLEQIQDNSDSRITKEGEKIPDFNQENCCLLSILNELNSPSNTNTVKDIENKIKELDHDQLSTCFTREDFFRQQIEVVIENMDFNSKRINVLEVSQSESIMAQSVIQLIRLSTSDTKVGYDLLHPNHSQLKAELINGVDCHRWPLEKDSLPSISTNYDLILYEEKTDLISARTRTNLKVICESLWNSVKDNGFLIVIHKNCLNFAEEVLTKICDKNCLTNEVLSQRKDIILSEAKRVGLSLVATKIDGISNKSSLIFRKTSGDIRVENQTFIQITNDRCDQWIERLQNELKNVGDRPDSENIWLLGEGCPTNGIIGFVNCLRRETNGHRIRCLFDYDFEWKKNPNLLSKSEFLVKIVKNNLVMNVLKSGNKSGSFRHFTIKLDENKVMSDHSYLNVRTRGDLSSFDWFEAQHKYWPLGKADNQELIDVYYAPLNFRDIMLATGKLSADALPDGMGLQDCILGLEFAGKDQNANRVMGMVPSKGLATSIVMEEMDFVWSIPEHWSMEEAATVPVVYATAYYALIIRGKLKPKESVLIHSGSGGVGQAAISICLSMDCRVFITCGSDAKREFLKKVFSPKLCDKNFWTSRDSTFESFVMKETNGCGVDVVLNSLSEDKLQASVRCLANSGRFLEIGKYDLSQNNELELSKLFKNKSFHGILLDSLFVESSKCSPLLKAQKQRLRHLIENGIREGTVRPLKTTLFDSSQVEKAFRFMASGQHIGKVVLKIKDENLDTLTAVKYPAVRRTVFKPNKCYIIVGGLGGFGMELVNWMVERGAKNIVLTSRSGVKTGYQKYRIKCWQEIGINIEISTKNVCDLEETQDLIKSAAQVGCAEGVAGIFNLAMVLSDALFENQTPEKFNEVLSPKATAVKNLDQLSRTLCPDLQYFVCFSSVSCGRGNSGQTNYGLANSVMERVCEYRRSACGLPGLAIQWGAIGDVGVVAESMGGNEVVIGGTLPQRITSCLSTLDSILQLDYPIVSSFVRPDLKVENTNKKEGLLDSIAVILGLKDYKNLDLKTSLSELGIDSLMSVEIKQTLDRDYELSLSTEEIRRLSIKQIIDIGQQK